MPQAQSPYAAYNYLISLRGPTNPEKILGGFSVVSGLTSHVQKITGMNKSTDVTLKRGLVDSSALSNWIAQARATQASGYREAIITLRDDAGHPARSWKLHKALPMRYIGPTLSGKGSDVAIQELVLSTERIEIIPPH